MAGPASDLRRGHLRQVRSHGLLHLPLHLRLRVLLQHPHRPGTNLIKHFLSVIYEFSL